MRVNDLETKYLNETIRRWDGEGPFYIVTKDQGLFHVICRLDFKSTVALTDYKLALTVANDLNKQEGEDLIKQE